MTTDTPSLTFRCATRMHKYGDGKSFADFTISMYQGARLVGIEHGDLHRSTTNRSDAIRLARQRVKALRSHRLFVIPVTKKNIDDGQARDCSQCAIAQALYSSQERMGLDRFNYRFEVSPYGAWTESRGIVLNGSYGGDEQWRIPVEHLPQMVINYRRKGFASSYNEGMMEWAMRFDEWEESRGVSLKEWREEHGYDKDEYPNRPSPCAFVLDLDAAVTEQEEVV